MRRAESARRPRSSRRSATRIAGTYPRGRRRRRTVACRRSCRNSEPRRRTVATRRAAIREPGSNNWVVGRSRSATGHPVVANDPHREVTNPSLRYIVHLEAPGWNVVGAGEPPFVGVALGHNERVAWGLTIVGTDQEDVYVEQVNPANANEVKFNGGWEPLRIVTRDDQGQGRPRRDRRAEVQPARTDLLRGRGASPRLRRRVAPLRSREPHRTSAGLRLAQAHDCREFLDAAMYWKAPTENLVCGDVRTATSRGGRPRCRRRARDGPDGCRCRAAAPTSGRDSGRIFRRSSIRRADSSRPRTTTSTHRAMRRR